MDCATTRTEKPVLHGVQFSTAAEARRLNPEDIELARKRAELNLYLEKAAELEREFAALQKELVDFRDRFASLPDAEGTSLARRPFAGSGLPAGRELSANTIPFPVPAARSKAKTGAGNVTNDRATANAYLPLIEAAREELRSEEMSALLDRNVLDGGKIPQAAFTLITGTAPAHCTEKTIPDYRNEVGAALISVLRRIYAARERILFLHRGIMKLRFSMLHRVMTVMQEAG